MRLLLKILAAPLIVALAPLVWICSGSLYCITSIFGLAGTLTTVLGVAVFIIYSVQNGIILLVVAFLVSPMGLPTAAVWLLEKLQTLRYTIQDWIYG